MPTIDNITVSRLSGAPKPLADRTVVFQTPGYDGYGVHKIGKGDNRTELMCVLYGTAIEVNNTYRLVVAKQSQIVTLVNDLGQIFGNVFLERVGNLNTSSAHPYDIRGEFTLGVLWGE